MALNDVQKQEALKLFSEGKSTLDVYKHFGAKSAGFKSPIEFSTTPATPPPQSTNALTDVPQDIFTGVKQLGEGYLDRYDRLKESGSALVNKEQGVLETGVQFGANIAGGVIADPAYQLLRTGASFATTPEQETRIADKVGETAQSLGEKTGLTDWYTNLDDRTKRNINAALDIADVVPVGIGGKLRNVFKGATKVDATPKLQDALSRAEQGDISDATRIANATLDDATRTAEIDKLAKAYQTSLVGDRTKVNRLLQEQADDMTRGDVVVTQDDLIASLAAEGIIPDIRGKLADFTPELRNLQTRQNELFKAYEPVLTSSKASASLEDLAQRASNSIIDSPTIRFDITGTQNKLDSVIENIRIKYRLGNDGKLTAKQVDQISRDANAESKAFRDSGNKFEADVYSELGRVARSWLNENIPDQSFRQVNDEWLRLEQVKRTAEAMQNQQVDVGLLGRALGSYVTTLTGVTLGAAVANPFTAVAAGILTKMGGDAIADVLRSTKFSPEIRSKIQERLTSDKELIEKLKQTATTQENKNMYEEMSRLLPAANESGYRSEVSGGRAIEVGGQTPDGRVEPGITERNKEGVIQQRSDSEPAPLRRGIYPALTDQEIKQLNSESFKKLLENAGVDAEAAQRAIVAGVGGYLLMSYMGEDGSLLPAGLVILSAMPVGVRRAALNDAIKVLDMKRDALVKSGLAENSAPVKANEKARKALIAKREQLTD